MADLCAAPGGWSQVGGAAQPIGSMGTGIFTPLKFDIAPKIRQSQKDLIFQSSFFRGYIKFRGCTC